MYELPSPQVLADIGTKQDARARELRAARAAKLQLDEEEAARVIQRNYRGYRERRQLKGMSLDPSSRWLEVRYNTPEIGLRSLL